MAVDKEEALNKAKEVFLAIFRTIFGLVLFSALGLLAGIIIGGMDYYRQRVFESVYRLTPPTDINDPRLFYSALISMAVYGGTFALFMGAFFLIFFVIVPPLGVLSFRLLEKLVAKARPNHGGDV